jgi:hypothetical protein
MLSLPGVGLSFGAMLNGAFDSSMYRRTAQRNADAAGDYRQRQLVVVS